MINLLSSQAQATLAKDYRHRRRLVAGLLSLAALLASLALGGVLLVQLRLQARVVETELNQATTASAEAELRKTLTRTAAELALLKSRGQSFSPSAIRQAVIARQPTGVSLSSWQLSAVEAGAVQLSLGGQARDRQNLLAFIAALQQEPLFSTVDSPVANLIKSQNPIFTIKLTLAHAPGN